MLLRLLWMALPSLTLASSSRFFCWMASGIWARMDLLQSMAAFTSLSSFSSSARLASSRDNSRSTLREEFFKWSIDYDSSLASCLLQFPLANKVSRSNRFLWACFTFKTWPSKIEKEDKTLERAGDGYPWWPRRLYALDQYLRPNQLYSSQTLAEHLLADFWSLLARFPWRRWLTN